jgi:hypothetical protein
MELGGTSASMGGIDVEDGSQGVRGDCGSSLDIFLA